MTLPEINPNDRHHLHGVHPTVLDRRTVEVLICRRMAESLIGQGYVLSVWDGEEYAVKHSADVEAVMQNLLACDEEIVRVSLRDTVTGATKSQGTVTLVYGNDGWDLIADHAVGLTEALADVTAYAASLEEAL